ncbi:hypothetical protein [Paraburkholderia sp. SIMBA_030]|uniref:hypothetical protein n=1 Tax=Paraburkholderia sp. SIMBA_030 TaxID=3085773 RepID=UPI00397BA14C
MKVHYTWCLKFSFALYLVLSCGAPLPEHGAASIPDGEKTIPAARLVERTGSVQKHPGKRAQQVIAIHTMKTVFKSNSASSQSYPATRLGRPFFRTPSLAHAAAQRSF